MSDRYGRYQPSHDCPRFLIIEGVMCEAVQWWRDGWVSFATVIADGSGAMFIASWYRSGGYPAQDFHPESEQAAIVTHLRRVARTLPGGPTP